MLRFIIEKHEYDFNSGLERKDYRTILIDLPEMEDILSKGGRGECGFESWKLIGVEIVEE